MTTEATLESILGETECLRPRADSIASFMRTRWPDNRAIALYERFKAFADWAMEVERQAEQDGKPRTVLKMPVDPWDLVAYAEWLAAEGRSMSTISTYVSAIGTMHTAAGFSNPTASAEVKNILTKLRLALVGDESGRARPLLESEIRSILNTLYTPRISRGRRKETPEGARRRADVDKALLLTMIQAGMRRSDAVDLSWGDIREAPDGSGLVLLNMFTSREYKVWVPITEACMESLKAIKPDGVNSRTSVFNLSGNQINRRIKRMCAEAGMDQKVISGHTLRATLRRILRDSQSSEEVADRQLRRKPPKFSEAQIITLDDTGGAEGQQKLRPVAVEIIDETRYSRLYDG